jgi:hypothetical protein
MKTKTSYLAAGILLSALLTGFGQPGITTQPQDQTNYVGTTATFTVVASGAGSVSYRWQKYTTNFVDLTEPTNATLTLANVQTNDATDYRVVVTDDSGSTNSAAAHLYVIPPETLSISQPSPGLVTLSWKGSMVLIQAGLGSGSLDCPAWIRLPGTSPVTLAVGVSSQYFKLVALPPMAELQATIQTNLVACRGGDAKACEDCLRAYFLTAPIITSGDTTGRLRSDPSMEEAAVLGAELFEATGEGSCVPGAYTRILLYLRRQDFGP